MIWAMMAPYAQIPLVTLFVTERKLEESPVLTYTFSTFRERAIVQACYSTNVGILKSKQIVSANY
jgi:hypothetical protein